MLEDLIELIDNFEISQPEQNYMNFPDFVSFFPNSFNQILLDKVYHLLSDSEGILKYDFFSLFILLSKGSFESKINCNRALFRHL